ncbi:hypothetical protein OIDMADRAFT_55908 [Oidiodendron maius Zn]|uniref:Uncharacterized protein n=1 Tax=Oidiodendron maius (strain Zn) TaxID=913774 RepID=A0A0C3CLW7_OIDMZ|nr:hypothetical protein OIDMADRAFT_55908 [Oidiodendron maius Zn]
MLCTTSFTYAAGFTPRWNSKGRLTIFTQQSNQQIFEGQAPAGLDLFSMLTSKMLIHELMHAIDFRSFPAMLSPGVLEAYGVNNILGLTTTQAFKLYLE